MRKKERLVGRAEEESRGGYEDEGGGGVKAAYSGHQPGSRHDQTRHYGGDEEKQTHGAPQPPLCQKPNIANYPPQLINFTPKSTTRAVHAAIRGRGVTVTCHSNPDSTMISWTILEAESVTS